MISREGILHQQVCNYLKLQYPDVMFRTDFAAGIKMTIGQARRHKALQHSRAWPDLFIAEQRHSKQTKEMYGGLFIELKADNIYLRDGSISKNAHVQEQFKMLGALIERGYQAKFAVGFDEARAIIDDYLSTE